MVRKYRPQEITHRLWALLQTGQVAKVWHERASLTYRGGQFVMEGPSGTHTLCAKATDESRLDAHWQIFAAAPGNQYA